MSEVPNTKKDERTPYWEAFKLDRTWKRPPRRKTILKSTFGPQVSSKRITSPSFGFGTANRHAFNKMYLSAEMAKTKPGCFYFQCSRHNLDSTQELKAFLFWGPAYEVLSSFGKQIVSQSESPPEIKMGTGSRWKKRKPDSEPGPGAYDPAGSAFGDQVQSEKKSPEKYVFSRGTRAQSDHIFLSQELNKAKFGTQSPGPMVYGARTTFGFQADSKDRTAPVINFTKGQRVLRVCEGDSAGPGEYPIKGSVGKQPESHKATLPAFSFPHCSRARMDKVFLSKEHDKAHYGESSPGPATLKQVSSMGNQALSKCVNPPFIKFPKGTRWNRPPDDMPGPGTYDV